MRTQEDEVAATMVEAARGHVAMRFSWGAIARTLVEVMQRVCSPKQRAGGDVLGGRWRMTAVDDQLDGFSRPEA
jgi:hypothetical protein